MKNSIKLKKRLALLYRYAVAALVCLALIVAGSLIWNIYRERQSIQTMAINEGLSSFKRDEAFRLWIASRGGVYVPLDHRTPSNPYLNHPERDITTTSGKTFTLVNGAYFFRQVMEEYGHATGVNWRLTSLKPTNPENIPDEWERKTLLAFEQGAKMIFEFNEIKGEPHLRLLSPLVTQESCLKCHEYQGYKVGEIRGAMGVSLAMAPYLLEQRKVVNSLIWTHGIFMLCGLIGIGFVSIKYKKRLLENLRAEDELEEYRDQLEELVKERTRELTEANLHLSEEITERKRAEEEIKRSLAEKEVLLKEIHHRVKNNLQIISSMLHLQSKSVKDKKAVQTLREGQNRVKSMVLIHEKVYQSGDLERVNFNEYLQNLTANLFRSYGVSQEMIGLKLNIDHVLLTLDKAILCGLIVNELVSNVLKHAFPAGGKSDSEKKSRGEIRIDLRLEKNNELTLVVGDNGIGFPEDLDFRDTESLGLQLVNTLVGQLEGSIELRRDGGSEFEIRFKG